MYVQGINILYINIEGRNQMLKDDKSYEVCLHYYFIVNICIN